MKNNFKILSGVCLTMFGLATAHATTFDLTFTDFNNQVDGVGVVTGTDNGNGSYTLTSGSWDVVAGADAGVTGTLDNNPSAPGTFLSPSGYFEGDNVLYLNGPATVDYWGLIFTTGSSPGEINLYSDSPSQYDQYFNDGNDVLGTLTVQVAPVSGIQSAPDSGSCAGLMGLAFAGMVAVRRKFKK